MRVLSSDNTPSAVPESVAAAGEGATVIYTYGACSGNPGPGGWAWATTDGRQDQGGSDTTTNQRMELQAVLEALLAISGPAVVHSDSTYVVNCFNDRWYEGWRKRGWKNSQRKPVANRDLWEPLIDLYLPRRDELDFRWVKGHSGDAMNDLVDALAVEESTRRKEAAAVGATTGAAPDPAGAPLAPQPPWPVDQAVAVTGVAEPDADQIEALTDAVGGLDPGYDIVVSGLRRGTELMAAELAIQHGVSLAVVLPFPEPAARWPQPLLARFEACTGAAEWVVTLEGDPSTPGTAVTNRNEWLWHAAVGAVIVGDDALVTRLDDLGLGVIAVD